MNLLIQISVEFPCRSLILIITSHRSKHSRTLVCIWFHISLDDTYSLQVISDNFLPLVRYIVHFVFYFQHYFYCYLYIIIYYILSLFLTLILFLFIFSGNRTWILEGHIITRCWIIKIIRNTDFNCRIMR